MADAAVSQLGVRAWDAALALLGTPFRLHGRTPDHGLDCVGLVVAAYRAAGHDFAELPDRYRLHGPEARLAQAWLSAAGAHRAAEAIKAGDVALIDLGSAPRRQLHLMILNPGGGVHAHAGLRRVAFCPLPLPGRTISRWRLHQGD